MDSFTLDKIEFDAVRRILAGFCCCSLGKGLAARIGPSRNPEIIRNWLRQVSQMVQAVRDTSLPPLAGATDITDHLNRARPGGNATGDDFAVIAGVLEAVTNVANYLASLPDELDTLHTMQDRLTSFEREIDAIRTIVDADGNVRDSASPKLAELRREMLSTAQQIHDVIYGYLRQPEVAKLLQNATVTLHGDRYVLPVKSENRGRLPGVVHRASNTGATVFVEPNASVELNNRLADLADDERREVQRLLNELSVKISAREKDIESSMRTLGHVDLLSAKAQYAYQFDMTCPELTERGAVMLGEARHPLLIDQAWRRAKSGTSADEQHPVVPIDIRLGSDFDILVITGSNTGGKTVTLKTVALLAVMVQSGMHIPVQRGAQLPVFRNIYIDIGDEQSLQQSLSTFGAHIKRIKYILQKTDKSSLVLLDELGAGTDPDEGSAIGQAVLDELRRIGCMGMVTTHLSVLKAYALNHERVDNASVEFDTATLCPTYHLHIGTPGESHAITVAQKLGMGKRLIASARKHLGSQGEQFRRAIKATGAARQSAETARTDARKAELAAETQQEIYQAKLADIHRLKEEFELWLARLTELKGGDEVFVPSLNKKARLVRLELHKQVAVVDSAHIQVEVPLSDLMPDLGQASVREELSSLRKDILDQARQTQTACEEANRVRDEYHRSMGQQKQRARQFDSWLSSIGRMKVGDEVPIARKPGTGKLVSVDMPAMRAAVKTNNGELELSLQDLFPQTGPFAKPVHKTSRQHKHSKHKPAQPPKPVPHRKLSPRQAEANTQAVLATPPGEKVFVVPFSKQATLIRFQESKNIAVVQSGIFELEIPLTDLEPISKS